MTKIAVLGAGSIGCWLGGHLSAGGVDVTFIGRDRYARAFTEYGLTLTHFDRAPLHVTRGTFVTKPDALEGADIVALCVKSQDTAEAADQILKYAPDACVVSFQNGIRNPETLRKVFPADQVVPAIVPFNVTPAENGGFHCGTAGALTVGRNSRLTPMIEAFEATHQGIEVTDQIIGDQWAKMIVNLNNGLNTLTGVPLKQAFLQRDYRRAFALCVEEALGVAGVNGIDVGRFNGRRPSTLVKTLRLPNWAYGIVMQLIVKIDAKARSSMLDDLEIGRRPEIDYLQGEIVRQAEQVGLSAPRNAAILEGVLTAFADGKSPKFTGSEILELVK